VGFSLGIFFYTIKNAVVHGIGSIDNWPISVLVISSIITFFLVLFIQNPYKIYLEFGRHVTCQARKERPCMTKSLVIHLPLNSPKRKKVLHAIKMLRKTVSNVSPALTGSITNV